MSFLKRGPLLGLLGGALVLWLLVFFCFDPLLKLALVAGAQAANGAKVDLDSLKTKWLQGTLVVAAVEVADPDETMRNTLSFDRAAFRLDMSAALRGKAVVREASVEGVRFGTKRRRDGRLPAAPPPSKLELAAREKLGFSRGASVGAQVKGNAAAAVDEAKLTGLKKADEAKAKAKEVEERWKSKPAELKAIEVEIKQVAEQLKALGAGGNDAASILRKVAEAQKAQAKIKELIARSEAIRKEAQKDLGDAQALVKEVDALRGKDLDGLLAAAGLPTLDSESLTRRLLGPQAAGKVAVALKWVRWAREKAAAKKAATPPPPPRRRGVDVEFPRAHAYPQFLLEGAKLGGELSAEQAGRPVALSGLLTGVTSNPKLYGKPARLELAGASDGLRLDLKARLDQQLDPVGVVVEFDGSGFPLAGSALGDGEVGGTIAAGSARVRGVVSTSGEEWKGEVLVTAAGVSIEPKVALDGTAGRLVSDALRSLPGFTVKIGLSGREDDLKFAVSSDLGTAVAGAMKKAVAGELDAQRKALEAKVNALYEERMKGVRAQTDGLSKQVLGPLDAQKGELDRLLKDALGKAAGGNKLPDLKKLFR
ncbi:MAG: TIGR03545 family protein [Elusimicrobiota bacterium]|nr:TIGR03545 family protein [Elusimicrobiota bacterium]